MSTRIEVVGVYVIFPAAEPVHLVEGIARGSVGPFKIGDVTQSCPDTDPGNWQVAYDEKILNPEGTAIVLDPWSADSEESPHWKGDVRFAFFFHDLDTERPLSTPFGAVDLPQECRLPARLEFMEYVPPG